MSRHVFQNIAIAFFIVLFLADAINVDELFGITSIQHDDETSVVDQSSAGSPSSVRRLPILPVGYSNLPRTPGKLRLELVDVDSPSLEASYVSRDEVAPIILSVQTTAPPASAEPEPSFYSLCKLQI